MRSSLLEPCAVKVACTVLRGGGGSDATSLPDTGEAMTIPATKTPNFSAGNKLKEAVR